MHWLKELKLYDQFANLLWIPSLCVLLAASTCFGQPVPAQEIVDADNAISWGMETDINSKYVWHGLIFADETVIQPTAWISMNGLTCSVWNNQVPGNEPGLGTGDEVDLSAAYEWEIGPVGTEFAFAYYVYPNQDDSPSTGELSARLTRGFGSFEFSTGHSLDIIEYDGAYFGDVQLMLEREFADCLSYNIATSLGWASAAFNNTYAGVNRDALNMIGGTASISWYLTDNIYIRPHFESYRILNNSIADMTKRDVFSFGGVVGFEL
jgi:hypothetical protein